MQQGTGAALTIADFFLLEYTAKFINAQKQRAGSKSAVGPFHLVQFVQPLLLEDIAVFQYKIPVIVAEKPFLIF